MEEKFPKIPLFAVVAEDNVPSLRTFEKLGCRKEDIRNKTEYSIGSGNKKIDILKGWPHRSFVFWF